MGKPLGRVIRAARLRKGLRLQDMADAVGCSVPFASDVELGRRWCPIGMAYMWAELLDADPVEWAGRAIEARYEGELNELGLELRLSKR